MAVEPQSGQFTLDDTIKGREPITRGQRFTQADINQGRVWCVALIYRNSLFKLKKKLCTCVDSDFLVVYGSNSLKLYIKIRYGMRIMHVN